MKRDIKKILAEKEEIPTYYQLYGSEIKELVEGKDLFEIITSFYDLGFEFGRRCERNRGRRYGKKKK